jgi:hypothetical protein
VRYLAVSIRQLGDVRRDPSRLIAAGLESVGSKIASFLQIIKHRVVTKNLMIFLL